MAGVIKKVPFITLNNGLKMPMLGLGTWKSEPGEVYKAVKNAIDVGYRLIDGAHFYQNEKEVGAAVKSKIDQGVVKRENLFLMSKLWNSFHRPELVMPSLKVTLSDLNVDCVEMYLMHFPMGFHEDTRFDDEQPTYSDIDYVDTWRAMEECVTKGLTKSIGVCNFNSEQLKRILSMCRIKPVTNQVECNPYLSQRKLLEFCTTKEIKITGYSPLGSPDRPWAKPEDPKLLEEPKLIAIGKKYGKSPAQVALRFQIQRDIIVIPKSVNKNRLAQNIDIFDFTLSNEDMKQIYTLECNGRAVVLEWFQNHKYYPFNIEF